MVVVDHHLRDRVVGQERLDRPVAEDVRRDLAHQARAVGHRERRAGLGQRLVDGLLDVFAQLVLGHLALDQVLAQLAHRLALCGVLDLDEGIVDDVRRRLHLAPPGRGLVTAQAAVQRSRLVGFHRRLPTTASSDRAMS